MAYLRGLLKAVKVCRPALLETDAAKGVTYLPGLATGRNNALIQRSCYSTPPRTHARDKHKDLYAVMGISPHATQQQIKEAYYNLSMKYHPDKNKGSEQAHSKFTELTEAYSVLGSHDLRRKYDKGLLHDFPSHRHGTGHHTEHWSHTDTSSTVHGQKIKFDFDEFYRAHYGEALKREQEERKTRQAAKERAKLYTISHSIQQVLIITVVVSVLVVGWYGNNYYWKHKVPSQRHSSSYPVDKM